jgi:hypothetical protein
VGRIQNRQDQTSEKQYCHRLLDQEFQKRVWKEYEKKERKQVPFLWEIW